MSGFQTLLAQLAVNELLKSLSENDYFFVIRVSNHVPSTDSIRIIDHNNLWPDICIIVW